MKRRILKYILSTVCMLVLVMSCIGCASKENASDLTIQVLDVGQGLSILITCDGHSMLYDGGGRSFSSYVVSTLKQQEIDHLDYLVASHYDEDHIHGLVGVLKTTDVDTVLDGDYSSDTKIYQSYRSMLASNGAKEIHPHTGDQYSMGDVRLKVLSPEDYNAKKENNNSIVLRLDYHKFSCIITGDAEFQSEYDMLMSDQKLNADILIVGHHGSAYSTSPDFVEAISPSYSIISVGKDNRYGHPADDTLSVLETFHSKILRTDQEGTIVITSDGKNFDVSE